MYTYFILLLICTNYSQHNIINNISVTVIMALRFIRRTYNRMFLEKYPKPPYTNHVVQVGDPVLRNKSSPIHPDDISTKEVKNVRIFAKHYLLSQILLS